MSLAVADLILVRRFSDLALDMTLEIRRARPDDTLRAQQFYAARRYGGGIGPGDSVLIAEHDGELVGIVRLAPEQGIIVLRGMQVHPAFQHQGIGTQLLAAVARVLGTQVCFCIPYAHLVRFYGQIDFVMIDPAKAPPFLSSRLMAYRQRGDGKEYVLMCRN